MELYLNEQQIKIIQQVLDCVEGGPVGWEAIPVGNTETCATSERCDKFLDDVKDIKMQLEDY